MAASLMDRFGLGNDRAVANARRAAVQRQAEDWMVARLLERIRRREQAAPSGAAVRDDRAA